MADEILNNPLTERIYIYLKDKTKSILLYGSSSKLNGNKPQLSSELFRFGDLTLVVKRILVGLLHRLFLLRLSRFHQFGLVK